MVFKFWRKNCSRTRESAKNAALLSSTLSSGMDTDRSKRGLTSSVGGLGIIFGNVGEKDNCRVFSEMPVFGGSSGID
jgi:hypothetical protein